MDLDQLRASILDHLGIHLHEEEHADLDGAHDDVLITVSGPLLAPLTDWLDATDTGRHVWLDGSAGAPPSS